MPAVDSPQEDLELVMGLATRITNKDASNPDFEFSLVNDDTEIGGVARLDRNEEGELSGG